MVAQLPASLFGCVPVNIIVEGHSPLRAICCVILQQLCLAQPRASVCCVLIVVRVQVEDCQAFSTLVRWRHPPSLPAFIGGQSMGGLVALHVALADQSLWRGILLCSAAVDIEWTRLLRYSTRPCAGVSGPAYKDYHPLADSLVALGQIVPTRHSELCNCSKVCEYEVKAIFIVEQGRSSLLCTSFPHLASPRRVSHFLS